LLSREFGLDRSSTVLDLAAGTGKLTRLLVARFARVVAVEPSAPMRDVLGEALPGAEAVDGTAEAIPLADGSVDAVFVGEAFHWFQTADAAREIARVLRPGGGLGLLWNHPTWTEEEFPWLADFRRLTAGLREAFGPMPIAAAPWEEVLDGLRVFEPLRQAEAHHDQVVDADGFVAMIASWTWIVALPDDRRAELLAQVHDLLPSGELRLPYRTDAHWTRLRG
jgi:SAM-dependent methyltransferase